jgi:hypothetical protein
LSTTEYLDRRATFKISARDLDPDEYFVAVFNMNYYRNADCEYVVRVESTFEEEYGVASPGFMTVVLVVIMAMFVCMLFSACRRLVSRALRRRSLRDIIMGREAPDDWGDFPMNAQGGRRGSQAPRGCPRHVMDAIPRVEFGSEAWDSGKWGKEDESCSVCIDGFEPGETLLCLPECRHAFHKDCIEGWLAQHTTCPNCRASLVPSAEGDEDIETGGATARTDGRDWRRDGEGNLALAPASPPGVVEGAPTSGDFESIAAEARHELRRADRERRGGAPVVDASR